jgi:hypothetical protein
VDLAKDVLFDLVSKDYAHKAFMRIDDNVWNPLVSAIRHLKESWKQAESSGDEEAVSVFEDQYYRTRALKCLYTTLRNTAVWIYAVHEYQESNDRTAKAGCRKILDEMIEREIQNCRDLIDLWKKAPIEWMIVSGTDETPFIHSTNFVEWLGKKVSLMKKHREDEPSIDPDYMFRLENNPYI